MNSRKFKHISDRFFLLAILIPALWACTDANTDFTVANNYKRMFSPVTFTSGILTSSSVQFQFSKISQTSKYVIDISKQDSMKFDSIKATVEFLPDTMKFVSGTTNMYSETIHNLLPATRYSARIKAVSADGITADSKYDYVVFDTKAQ